MSKIKWDELTTQEKNNLITEKVMGWKPELTTAPCYTENLIAAWQIIQRLSDLPSSVQDRFMEEIGVDSIGNEWDESGITLKGLAELTPEKICLAALKAVRVKIVS